jgi:hypothetical protein
VLFEGIKENRENSNLELGVMFWNRFNEANEIALSSFCFAF